MKKRKGYLKIHVVSLGVSDDGKKLVPIVRGMRVKKVLGDGAYEIQDNFKFLAACGIEREDSNPNCGGAREVDGRDILFRIQEAVWLSGW